MNANIENCNVELLEKQKEQLKNEIIYGKNSDFFKIYDIEACCGKTRTTEAALAEMVTDTTKNAILVRMKNVDCRESVENINKMVGETVAFAYNNEDVSGKAKYSIQKELNKYRVLVITHQKYKALSLNPKQRQVFSEDRSVLVVDEFISNVEKIKLTMLDINTYKKIFVEKPSVYDAFTNIIKGIEEYIILNDSGRYHHKFELEHTTKQFKELAGLIKSNYSNDTLFQRIQAIDRFTNDLESVNHSLLHEIKTVNQFCKMIMEIKEFFLHLSVYDNNTLYTVDSRYKNWFLENNILLDASGELQCAYALDNKQYSLVKCDKVLDHSQWRIINIVVNTTTAGKERMNKFYDVVNDMISKYGEDILVIGNQKELNEVVLPEESKGYFGNVTGSNEWGNKKNIAIIQTHNLNDIDFILKCLYYSEDYIKTKYPKLTSHSHGRRTCNRYSFDDARFEDIRNRWLASETYQALKRVNRNMAYSTDALVFMNNDDVINMIQSQMKNCLVEVVYPNEKELGYIENNQDAYINSLKKKSNANKFIKLMAEIREGKHNDLQTSKNMYKKKVIREYLGIKDSGNFTKQVLNKSEVIEYCKVWNIKMSGQYIEVNC